MTAFNQILGDKEQYIAQFEELLTIISDTTELEQRLAQLQSTHDAKIQTLKDYIEENKRQVQDQAEYHEKYNALHAECSYLETEIASLQQEIHAKKNRKTQICRYLNELRQYGDILTEFDADLWNAAVESVTVGNDKSLTFLFRDGTKVPVFLLDKSSLG